MKNLRFSSCPGAPGSARAQPWHGLNFNHLHTNNNNDDDDELKKFYRVFIVYRLCLDNIWIFNLSNTASKTADHVNQKIILKFLANNLILVKNK